MKTHSVLSGGDRLDRYMMSVIDGTTRSQIQSLIKSSSILVNQKQVKPSYILRESDLITYDVNLSVNNSKSDKIKYENIKVSIVHEDDSIIVVDKQPGLVVHPGAGNLSGTLLNGVINKIDTKGFETNPGIVHRLDKETSGIMVLAKNHMAHSQISNQFENRKVKKTYHALVWGDIESEGTVEGNIA